jgi:acetyl-CoA synthetase
MPWGPIVKSARDLRVPPNLSDYQQACRTFSWAEARRALDGRPLGRDLNIAHEAVDRHAAAPRGAVTRGPPDGVSHERCHHP